LIQFAKSEGALYFVAEEKKDNALNKLNFRGEERHFVFDPASMRVSFVIKTKSGKLINLTQPFLPTENGRHRIFISWEANGGTLVVDGKQQSAHDN
jgi:hypothetical protein